MVNKTVLGADLFCGAGGTSTGLLEACVDRGYKLKLLAINHWDIAIATHTQNHPKARHLCESMDNVNPRKVIPGGKLDILVASPECTHHSNARGGRPMCDQSRASAWHVLRWAEALRIKNILIENVPEFQNWGPLGANGRPLKSKRGELFKAFINSLRAMGYYVDYKVLNAADYGDPTTRRRLFVIARKGRKIVWPTRTHSPKGEMTLLGRSKKWRSAREIIDWEIPGKSIFNRKRPLSENTINRIKAGIQKYCSKELEPFLVEFYGNGKPRSLSEPLPTATTKDRFGIVEPFIMSIAQTGAKSDCTRSIDKPLPTILTKQEIAVCEPFIVPNFGEREGQKPRVHSIDKPLPTVTSHGAGALVQPEYNGYKLDIKFRMLAPHELARAMSFGDDYEFSGKKQDVVRQIGNAVPVQTAKQLCLALIG